MALSGFPFKEEYLSSKQMRILTAVSLVVPVLLFFRSYRKISTWNYTHWLFTYQDEFTKRGLVGEVLRLFGLDAGYDLIKVFALSLCLVVMTVLLYVFSKPLLHGPRQAGLWLFLFFAASSSATIQHFNYDSGRFDGFTLLLLLVALGAASRGNAMRAVLVIPLVLSTAILIHEAAFFMVVPLVITFWMSRGAGAPVRAVQWLVVAGLMMVTYFVATSGLVSGQSFDEHYAVLQRIAGDRVHAESLSVLYKGGIPENMQLTLDRGLSSTRLGQHGLMLLGLLPSLILLWRLCEPLRVDRSTRYVILSAWGPLLLYPLGHDHFRWWSFALTNVFVVLALAGSEIPDFRKHIATVMFRNKLLTLVAVLVALITGPLGIISSFPRVIIK